MTKIDIFFLRVREEQTMEKEEIGSILGRVSRNDNKRDYFR